MILSAVFSSCYVSQLDKHLLKCNSRPKQNPNYIEKNINVFDTAVEDDVKLSINSLSDEELLSFIEKVSKIHSGM